MAECGDSQAKTPMQALEYSREAIAIVRAMARTASGNSTFMAFARSVCLSEPCAQRASLLLQKGNYKAITQVGQEAMSALQKALQSYLTFSSPTKISLEDLGDALCHAEGLLESSQNGLYERWDSLPDILSARDASAFLAFNTEFLNAICLTAATNFGIGALRSLGEIKFGIIEESFESLSEARKQLELLSCKEKALGTWEIKATPPGDGVFEQSTGCCFSLSNAPIGEILKQGAYRRVSPNVYVADRRSPCVMVGKGYIVGVDCNNACKLCEKNAHGKLPVYAFEECQFDIDDPIGSINGFFCNDDAFCIHPEDLAFAVDRAWRSSSVMGGENRQCPVCGRRTAKTLFCSQRKGH